MTTSLRALRAGETTDLGELVRELDRLEATRFDDVVDTRRMSFATMSEAVMNDDTGTVAAFLRALGDVIAAGPGNKSYLTWDAAGHDSTAGGIVNEYAHGQIRERLGIPGRYYDRMRTEATDLLDRNVQHWLHNPEQGRQEKRMVRMLDGKVRAFLSNRYRRLDHLPLLNEAVLPELARHGEALQFQVASLTPDRLYIRALLPGLASDIEARPGDHTFLSSGGDIVQAGVQIKNSEVGAGALDITPFIWRLRCLNGLVMPDTSLRRYHVGREQEELAYAMYQDDTLRADDAAFFLKVRDAVRAALSETQFTAIVGQLRETLTGERVADPVAATVRLGGTYDLDETEQRSIVRFLAEGGDLSRWGTINAVTSAAKEADTWERQAQMEAIGGVLATLPENEWAALSR